MVDVDELNRMPFLFIAGRSRSGTTMLQTLLDANPQTILPFESRLIIHLKAKYFHVARWTPAVIDSFLEDLYKDKKFASFWNIKQESLKEKIGLVPPGKLTFQLLCKLIYISYPSPFPKHNIRLIGDKNPAYSIYINELLEIFPEAIFIHIIRDYRDNILSNRKSFSRKHIGVLAHGWLHYNCVIDAAKQESPHKFYTVRYEDLVSEPERYVPEICAFMGVDFDPSMLESYKKVNEVYTVTKASAMKKIHSNLLNPINAGSIGKWKSDLTDFELQLADYIDGKFGARYGYEPVHQQRTIRLAMASLAGRIGYGIDTAVVKLYYTLPFWMRDAMAAISGVLYRKLGFFNYYNESDFEARPER